MHKRSTFLFSIESLELQISKGNEPERTIINFRIKYRFKTEKTKNRNNLMIKQNTILFNPTGDRPILKIDWSPKA